AQQGVQPVELLRAGMALHGLIGLYRLWLDQVAQHVLGQRQYHGAWPAAGGGVEGTRHHFGDAFRLVDLCRPLHNGPIELAIVDLLEGLALKIPARYLADEEDHRGGVLRGNMNARACVGRTRATGDETDARASRSEEHTSELQSRENLVCRLLLEKKKK